MTMTLPFHFRLMINHFDFVSYTNKTKTGMVAEATRTGCRVARKFYTERGGALCCVIPPSPLGFRGKSPKMTVLTETSPSYDSMWRIHWGWITCFFLQYLEMQCQHTSNADSRLLRSIATRPNASKKWEHVNTRSVTAINLKWPLKARLATCSHRAFCVHVARSD